jgi:uncharacterized protein YcbK (DUF882 family)
LRSVSTSAIAGNPPAIRLHLATAIVCLAAYFLAGSIGNAYSQTRSLKLYFLHTKERAEITYKINGTYIESGLKKINHLLRDWRRDEPTKMDPQLLDLLWEIYQNSGSRDYIHVVSAYRSPATNSMLRKRSNGVAKNSQHTLGKAIDFFLPDVKLAKLREVGLKTESGGVGYYPTSGSPFVHMDTGSVRHWPRMTREQLVKLFPDGKTLHLPTDGKPLPGYERAMASYKAKRSGTKTITVASAEEVKKPNFFQLLAQSLKRDQEDDEEEAESLVSAPVVVAAASPPEEQRTNIVVPVEALPVPVYAPRETPDTGTQIPVAVAALEVAGEQPFGEPGVPVPRHRPVVDTPNLPVSTLALADAQTDAQSGGLGGQMRNREIAALTPGEIEQMRRNAVASREVPKPQNIASRYNNYSEIRTGYGFGATIANAGAPRPAAGIPGVEGQSTSVADNTRQLSPDSGLQPSPPGQPVQQRPGSRPGSVPLSPAKMGVVPAPRPVETLHTGTILANAASKQTTGPSQSTLELALAAPDTGNSASQAIRDLIDVSKRLEKLKAKHANSDSRQQQDSISNKLSPPTDKQRASLSASKPASADNANAGRTIENSQRTVTRQEVPDRQLPGKWALVSSVPLGMISDLRAPQTGKTNYTNYDRQVQLAEFVRRGPLLHSQRFSKVDAGSGLSRNQP